MTLVNTETGELVGITEAVVRASVRRVIDHAESIWDEWAWQVENQTWRVLGYGSWDEMRRGEYSALTSVSAPRAERAELVSRFRGAGLTQEETAETLGVGQATVSRLDQTDNSGVGRPRVIQTDNSEPEPEIFDAEIVEDDEPEPRERQPRVDVVAVINRAILKAEQASAEAAQIKRSHLAGRKEEATSWGRRLNTALADIEELQRNLKEISA